MSEPGQPPPEDPIAEAFREHRRPPRDVVPRTPSADAPPIPTGYVPYFNDELGPDGVSRETGTAYVAAPVMSVEQLMQRIRDREERGDHD